MTTLSQKTFSSGEISPSLYARTDLTKYATGLRTCKNNLVLRYGGVSNRPGTEFIGEVSDSTKSVRLIPFIFNTDQTYVLEFGQLYMRVIKDGVQLKETAVSITGATQADPVVITTGTHGYTTGDEVYISDVVGMTELNGRSFKITVLTGTTFSLQLMDGTTDLDGTAFTAYSSGGDSEKVYEITTTYTAPDLSTLNYVQSADTVTLVHPSYPPAELTRTADTTWTLSDLRFLPDVEKPTAVSATAGGAGSNTYRYKVTAIDAETGEESLAGIDGTAMGFSGVTQANPAVVTTGLAHGLATGDEVFIDAVNGMTELNDRNFTVTVLTTTTFELDNTDSTNMPRAVSLL